MGRKPGLTQHEQGVIDGLHMQKLSVAAISRTIKRSRCVVQRYISDPQGYGKRKMTSGNSKISALDARHILREGAKGSSSAAQIKFTLSLPITKRRVQQLLSSSEHLQYRKFKQAPPLTALHLSTRLNWARERHAWTSGQWAHVVFSDEKKWNLDGPDGFAYYWHDLRKEERILSRRQNGGGGVMIWAAFCETGFSEIAFLGGNQNAQMYTETLENYLVPFANAKFTGAWTFQQDNASIHTAHVARNWFSSKNITVMPWPAKSPDLNPIENVWGILSRRVYKDGRQFSSVLELKQCILQEWGALTQNFASKLVQSMTKRCRQVLERGGKKTDY